MASTDARPVPKKNTAYRHYFSIRKNDGTLITTWAGQDSELSADGGNFADATNEATEIQTSGIGYIDLTAGEMNYDCVVLKVTVTNTDALPYVVTLFPEEAGDIRTNVTQYAGSTAAATNGYPLVDVYYMAGGSFYMDSGYFVVNPATVNAANIKQIDDVGVPSDGSGYLYVLAYDDSGSSLATASALATADGVIDNVWGVVSNLNDTIEDNGGTYRFTTAALAQAPSGETAVTITPLQSSTINSGRQNTAYLTAYQHATFSDMIAVTDNDDNAVNLSGVALTFLAWDPDDTSTIILNLSTAAGDISVGGASNNQVTIAGDATDTGTAYTRLRWRLIGTSNDTQYAHGYLDIEAMADIPS